MPFLVMLILLRQGPLLKFISFRGLYSWGKILEPSAYPPFGSPHTLNINVGFKKRFFVYIQGNLKPEGNLRYFIVLSLNKDEEIGPQVNLLPEVT